MNSNKNKKKDFIKRYGKLQTSTCSKNFKNHLWLTNIIEELLNLTKGNSRKFQRLIMVE